MCKGLWVNMAARLSLTKEAGINFSSALTANHEPAKSSAVGWAKFDPFHPVLAC